MVSAEAVMVDSCFSVRVTISLSLAFSSSSIVSDSFVQALEKQLFILCCKLLTDVGVGDYKFGDSRGLVPFGNGLEQLYVVLVL